MKLVRVWYRGRSFVAGIGRFDDGRLAEVFIESGESGEDITVMCRDAAVATSLALQHGVPVSTLRAALTRDSRGQAKGPLCALLAQLAILDESDSKADRSLPQAAPQGAPTKDSDEATSGWK